ncbi:hypothetical protein [Actinokineospora pegani]|uniref:hypothetical protein n=1 Tax=Actinokineospora pegani TaxID=2654637 RepID=UPI0012EA382E|nr:hypothetical protein [Actinokineospora pegani]
MYIDEGKHAALGKIGESMTQFAGAAAAGQFAVNEAGGQALIAAIDKLLDWLDMNQFKLRNLEQEPPLGSSNAAKVIKPYMASVATDHEGFLTQLRALGESLKQARQGIETAMRNYERTDSAEASKLT